nr:sterol 3-beta-glucosyltransferase UGT80B1 isoform X2 [Ziziphus jujuba var. spinosa]
MELEMERERTKPVAVFMAFGTKGDVYPIAAIAAGFASDQKQYNVILITHSAHEYFLQTRFRRLQKRMLTRDRRQECYSVVEKIFGYGPSMEGDFIAINFFALEGWSLAELFRVRCIVAAPYLVPYSAPSSFERQFKKELPLLYKYLQESPTKKVCWKDVIHWMWPLFTEYWESWRSDDLKLSPCPFTDPVTGLPVWHDIPSSPLLLYGFSKEVVECPDYWPSSTRVCGFWFLPIEWQYSCTKCREISTSVSLGHLNKKNELCSVHIQLQYFLETHMSIPPIFIGLSSVGSLGFFKDPQAFLHVLRTVLEVTSHRFILFTAGYEPLDVAIKNISAEASPQVTLRHLSEDCHSLFNDRLFCFSGTISYNWLFTRCAAAVHHGGSGTTAAALHAGIPQIVCPFMLDQFYWAERMFWLGVAPEPLKRNHLFPESNVERSVQEAANVLSRAIHDALSLNVKERTREISQRLSLEDGVSEAIKCIKEELNC